MPRVDAVIRAHKRDDGARRGGGPFQTRPPLHEGGVVNAAGGVEPDDDSLAPALLQAFKQKLEALGREVPRCIAHGGKRPEQDERGGALRVCCRERERHRTTLGPPANRRALGADGVQDGAHVAGPLLQRLFAHAVRESLSALVEDNDAREGRQALQHVLVRRKVPVLLNVGDHAGHKDDVARSAAEHAIGDVDIAALGIPGFGLHPRLHGFMIRPRRGHGVRWSDHRIAAATVKRAWRSW